MNKCKFEKADLDDVAWTEEEFKEWFALWWNPPLENIQEEIERLQLECLWLRETPNPGELADYPEETFHDWLRIDALFIILEYRKRARLNPVAVPSWPILCRDAIWDRTEELKDIFWSLFRQRVGDKQSNLYLPF